MWNQINGKIIFYYTVILEHISETMPNFLYATTFKIFIPFIADDSKLSVIEKYYKYCFSVNINVAFLKFHGFDWIWIVLSLQHVKNRQEMMHYLVKPEITGKV